MANLGVGTGFWAWVLPVQATNLVTNPSLEYFGTAGWGALGGGAAIGSSSAHQAYGVWSLAVTPAVASGGAFYNAGTPAVGSYTVSAWVRGSAGARYRLIPSEATNAVPLGSGTVVSNGGWQPLSASFAMPSGTGLQIITRVDNDNTTVFYLDGLQIESGTFPTSYIDGDQPGCEWLGAPHASTSQRSGQYRGGGTLVALADLGWNVDQMPGVGMPPMENSMQSYAVIDGAQYQRTRAGARSFTLTAKPIHGTTTADFHVVRQRIIDALKIDRVTPQQPTRFVYVGGQGTVQIDALYDHGLELGAMDGPMAEAMAVGFIAPDPYWHAPIQQGTTLAPLVGLGSTNYVVRRDATGKWGTMGIAGASLNGPAYSILAPQTGTVFVGGRFTQAGGTASTAFTLYNPVANTFGSPTGGVLAGTINNVTGLALAQNAGGSIFVGFNGTLAGGTVARYVAFYAGAWGTLHGGTIAGAVAFPAVWALAFNVAGTLFAGGDFLTVGGTTTPRIAQWFGAAWGSLTGGTVNNINVLGIQPAFDQKMYIAGDFSQAGGTTTGGIAAWNGAWGTLGQALGIAAGGLYGQGIDRGPDGRIYVGGLFGTAGGNLANNIAVWNGAGWSALGNGVQQDGATPAQIDTLTVGDTGVLFAGGTFGTAGGVKVPNSVAQWTGAAWVNMGILLPGQNAMVRAIEQASDGAIYVGGDFAGIGTAASFGTLVNYGRAEAYPTIRLRNTSATSARVYQVTNTTTNAAIYFNYAMLPGEVAELSLTPGNRSFRSSFQGNVFGRILPGSNLTGFSLLPGVNTVSFLADNNSLETALYFTPRGWSADSGTVY